MRPILFAVVAVAALGGCSMQELRNAAEAAVGQFHERLNAGRFQEIYQATAPAFKQVTSEEGFVQILTTVHGRLGTMMQADQTAWNVNYNNGATSVELSYDVRFAQGQATERFTYLIEGTNASLLAYHVNSPAMVGGGPAPAPAPANTAEPVAEGEGEGGK